MSTPASFNEKAERSLPDRISPEPHFTEGTHPLSDTQVVTGINWLPLIKKLSINLFVPFINGIMLGFGEIFAHELGMLLGWRTARGYDPTSMPPATNPKARRRWLFGLW